MGAAEIGRKKARPASIKTDWRERQVKSKMQGLVRLAAWTAAAVLVAGCAQNPAVKFPEIQRPRTVVIEDIPELRAMAEVGFEISQPFTEASDRFFVLRGQSPALLPTGDYVAQSTQMTVQQIATAPVPMSPGPGRLRAPRGPWWARSSR